MRIVVLVALLGCSRSAPDPSNAPADRVFVLDSGARCVDAEPGDGAGVTNGTRVKLNTTTWMEPSPADPLKQYPVADAVLRPGEFGGVVGKGGTRGRLLDEILASGPQPMRAGGRRRCAATPQSAGMLREGIPGWPEKTDLVVEVRIERFE